MKKIALALSFVMAAITPPIVLAATSSNCHDTERVFFSCQVGAKIASLCMQSKGEAEEYIEYRFGTPKRVELHYKGTSKDIPRKFFRAEIDGANNSGTAVWFSNKGTYYVFSAPVRGGPFLDVVIRGKRVSRVACVGKWAGVIGDLDTISNAIEVKSQAAFFSEVLGIENPSNLKQ